MRRTVNNVIVTAPIVTSTGHANAGFKTFLLEVYNRGLIVGSGSPEGVVEAPQWSEYADETGTAGNIKYIKKDADIAGDKTKGWVLI